MTREKDMQKPNIFKAILKTMRPKQWTKNVAVFAALVFDRQLTRIDSFERTLVGFLLFCLISSTVYIINDILDVESDRNHPTKKFRPIPSGQLSIPLAIGIAVVMLAVSFPLAFILSPHFGWICTVYFVMNLAYSKWLKHIPLLDVFILATGFVLRVAAGVMIIHVERFSPWLYIVTSLLSLYLGFGKRRAELSALSNGNSQSTRKVLEGYTIPFLDQLLTIVSSTTLIAYGLYTFSAPNLPDNHTMMLTIPFVMYGLFRYLYLVQVKNRGEAPEEMLLKDRPLQAVIGLWGLAVIVIFYLS
jgi:4-hydroxybenzoate polyprenyltransferase